MSYRSSRWRRPVPPGGGRRWRLPATIAAAALAVGGGGLGMALADTGGSAAASSISCPDVASRLPAVPERAKAEVDRNLALLDTQLDEANARLASSAGQGGPNFVQNAILGPLEDKRLATVNRIATAIGRVADRPAGLEALAPCALNGGGGGGAAEEPPASDGNGGGGNGGGNGNNGGNNNGGGGGNNGGGNNGGNNNGNNGGGNDGGAAGGAIDCPTVADRLPAIPAQAQDEVDRNLALLETQIDEANARLAGSAGQGGPNFVQNAILGPLEDKRLATINRIATAIGRAADRPAGLEVLAPCSLAG